MNDPLIDQFMACEVGNVADEAFHTELNIRGGVELLDRIGPCILLTHAFGGFWGWVVADQRPKLVKAILAMEINGNPFAAQLKWGATATPMTYDPPVTDVTQFKLVDTVTPADSAAARAIAFQIASRAGAKMEKLAGDSDGMVDERVWRRRVTDGECGVPEASGMFGWICCGCAITGFWATGI